MKIVPLAKHVKPKMARVNLVLKVAIAAAEEAATVARQGMVNVPKVPDLKARAAQETVRVARAMRVRAAKAAAPRHRAVVADATAPALALERHRALPKRAKSAPAGRIVHLWGTAPRPAKKRVPTRKKGAGLGAYSALKAGEFAPPKVAP